MTASQKDQNNQNTTLVELQNRFDQLQKENKRLSVTLERKQGTGQRFRALINNPNDSVFLVDPKKMQIIDSNLRAAKMLGYTREEMKYMPIEQVHPNDMEQLTSFTKRVFKQGTSWTDKLQCRCKDGTLLESEMAGSIFEIRDHKVMLAQIRDTSVIKQLERERDQSEAKFNSLAAVMNEGLIMVDNAGRIQYVNHTFCELVGYEESALLGQVAHQMPWIDAEADLIKRRSEAFQKGNSGPYELPYINKSGEHKWIQVSGTQVYDERGIVVGSIAVNTDITELKRVQGTLKLKNDELATLLYRISHDLRAPVCSIIGLIDMVKREELYGECLAQIDMMQGCAENLDEILQDLFEILQLAHKETEMKPIEIKSMVLVVIKSLETLPNFKHIKFNLKISKTLRYKGDVLSFRSIMYNLISNSINYWDPKRRMSFVNITARRIKSAIHIKVVDNGVGIRKKEQTKVFDMFYRAVVNPAGSGLGLYIVAKSIEKLGGTVALNSTFRKGTDLTVVLPETIETDLENK
ncbi:MAG: PAS domain-containing sensor histidine kinase [Flavobacteriales bacterium]|nr:PAS domain-containing sensor histidine kinase [Flavobacteriales bacterium]